MLQIGVEGDDDGSVVFRHWCHRCRIVGERKVLLSVDVSLEHQRFVSVTRLSSTATVGYWIIRSPVAA